MKHIDSFPVGLGSNVEVIEITDPAEISQILGSLMGGLDPNAPFFDLGSANYHFEPFLHVPREAALKLVSEQGRKSGNRLRALFGKKKKGPALEEVISGMLAEETTLDLNGREPYCLMGSTRVALKYLFDRFSTQGRSIALPIPNWHFWEMGENKDQRTPFSYFDGSVESNLVDKFKRVTKEKKIGAVVLSDPSTPLGYEFSRETVREIDKIAQREGIAVIVDDVVRGTRDKGSRDSVARWVSEPYVAEGFTHRLGEKVNMFSYILFPHGKEPRSKGQMPRNENNAAAAILQLLLQYASQPAVDELKERNKAFDKGFRESAPPGVITYRPFDSSLSTLVTLPDDYPLNGSEFGFKAYKHGKTVVAPMECFHPQEYEISPQLKRSFRVAVGNTHIQFMEEAGRHLGIGLTKEKQDYKA